MPFCKNCGAKIDETAKFCPSCGTSISIVEDKPRIRYRSDKEACFGPKGSGGGLWGAASAGVFLIGLAVLMYYNIWWPGIIILIALMIIIGSVVAYSRKI